MNYAACEHVKTYSDFLDLYDELSKLLLNLNKSDFVVSEKSALILGNFMHDNNLDKESSIKSILEYFKNLHNIEIRISFEPSLEFLEKIYLLIYQYVNKHFLIKYEIDPSQFLGATISYNGKIYKHSLVHNG